MAKPIEGCLHCGELQELLDASAANLNRLMAERDRLRELLESSRAQVENLQLVVHTYRAYLKNARH